ncbi:unnamed protein product, partial [Symbiodinium sp. CCMP2456]
WRCSFRLLGSCRSADVADPDLARDLRQGRSGFYPRRSPPCGGDTAGGHQRVRHGRGPGGM